jgi:hypothetical protein
LVEGWLTGAIVVLVAPAVDGKIALLLLLLFAVVICCCFGGVAAMTFAGFVIDCGDVDDTADVGGVADNEGFTVLGIPHIRDSVVLTTFRSGLLGSHILALSSEDIGLVSAAEEDECCAYAWILLQVPKIKVLTNMENTAKIKLTLFILMYKSNIIIYAN